MFRAAIVLVLAAITSATPNEVSAQESLKKILAAWKSRQEKYGDISISWNETRHLAEGSLQFGSKLSDPPTKTAATTHKFTYLLRLSGSSRFRVDRKGPQWFAGPSAFIDRDYFSAWNGEIGKSYYSLVVGPEDGYPSGFVSAASSDWDNRHLLPLLFHFRPFNSQFAPLADDEYVLSEKTEVVDGAPCLRMMPAASEGLGRDFEFFVDPAKQYSIVRVMRRFKDKVTWQVDIAVAKGVDGDWSPSGWRQVAMEEGGAVRETCHAIDVQVVRAAKLEAAVFSPEFPAGALVTDRSGGKKPEVYLVKESGAKRIITSAERKHGIRYRDYLTTESGEAAK